MLQILPNETALMVFLRVFEMCTREQFVQVGMITWGLWNRRNKWVWERVNGFVYGVRIVATNFLTEWREAQHLGARRGRYNEIGDYIWRKPMKGWVKVNTNAALSQDGSIRVGCVIQDSHRTFIGAKCCRVVGE